MTDRLPPVCSADQIRRASPVGLRIVWDENGDRVLWDVMARDDLTMTTRFTDASGVEEDHTFSFADLSNHSAFPIGTVLTKEDFETPAGSFQGTHAVVTTPDGDHHFFFSDDHPGPPFIIRRPGFLSQQVERSDLS